MLISSMKREVLDGRLVVGGVPAHCKDCLFGRSTGKSMEARQGYGWATYDVEETRENRRREGAPTEKTGAIQPWLSLGDLLLVFYEPDCVCHCTFHDKHPCWLRDEVRFCPEFVPTRPVEDDAKRKRAIVALAPPSGPAHQWRTSQKRIGCAECVRCGVTIPLNEKPPAICHGPSVTGEGEDGE